MSGIWKGIVARTVRSAGHLVTTMNGNFQTELGLRNYGSDAVFRAPHVFDRQCFCSVNHCSNSVINTAPASEDVPLVSGSRARVGASSGVEIHFRFPARSALCKATNVGRTLIEARTGAARQQMFHSKFA